MVQLTIIFFKYRHNCTRPWGECNLFSLGIFSSENSPHFTGENRVIFVYLYMWKILVITSDNCAKAQRASHVQKNIHLQPTNLPLRSDLVRTPTSVAQGIWKMYFFCISICHNIIIIEKKGKSQVGSYYHINFPLSMCPVAGQVFASFVCLVSLIFIYLYFSLLIYLSNFCRVRDLSSNMIASLPDKVFANLNSLIEL